MVGPRPEEERRSAYRRFQAGLVIVVGGSAGLIAVNGDAALPVIAAASLGGLVVGVVLVWQVFPGRRTTLAQRPTSLGTTTGEQSANTIGDDPDATRDDDSPIGSGHAGEPTDPCWQLIQVRPRRPRGRQWRHRRQRL